MKTKLMTTIMVIGALLVPVTAHASNSDRKHPMAFVKDSVITTKIKAKLASKKMSSLMNIKVETDSNVAVVLSGDVRTQQEANKAVSIARNTEGVTSVKSNIRVK